MKRFVRVANIIFSVAVMDVIDQWLITGHQPDLIRGDDFPAVSVLAAAGLLRHLVVTAPTRGDIGQEPDQLLAIISILKLHGDKLPLTLQASGSLSRPAHCDRHSIESSNTIVDTNSIPGSRYFDAVN